MVDLRWYWLLRKYQKDHDGVEKLYEQQGCRDVDF